MTLQLRWSWSSRTWTGGWQLHGLHYHQVGYDLNPTNSRIHNLITIVLIGLRYYQWKLSMNHQQRQNLVGWRCCPKTEHLKQHYHQYWRANTWNMQDNCDKLYRSKHFQNRYLITTSIPSTRYLLRICFEKSSLAGVASSFPSVVEAIRTSTQIFKSLSMLKESKHSKIIETTIIIRTLKKVLSIS